MSSSERLDVTLFARGLAESRERAQRLVMAGLVLVDGERARHAGKRVRPDADIVVTGADHAYVSRGGVKLAGALDGFRIDPTGLVCVDVGASTGGFSDCLLQRGASLVHAVDVGYGQLAWKIRSDPRVRVHERTNMRTLAPFALDPAPRLAVVDASFISLRLLLAPTLAQLERPAAIVALVKPQFEVGRESVGKGGVVRDAEAQQRAVESVALAAAEIGLEAAGSCASPITGAKKGNVEFFLHLVAGVEGAPRGPAPVG
ncbi:MAG: TlyA family RNA methyltransferase [Deltaproteobacteria bacterium]|nr:TlyA family RNA methyltransferase [Deltaproteobacteria bacterium]